jgi:hypothetical protein
MDVLLTRTDFRNALFYAANGKCVICGALGQDVHHIMERRLFPDGGYYVNNGALLCGACHLKAESTELSTDVIRAAAGITRIILPPHLYPDTNYDKWGNPILPDGRRLIGELFEDASVQKVIAPYIHLFDNRVKYPRTWHLPWSSGITDDDRVLPEHLPWGGMDIVITEKMDGENTTMYSNYLHARSIDYDSHVTRHWVKNFHAQVGYNIPANMRVCGENVSFKHSIAYDKLPSFFLGFAVWEGLTCLSWKETLEWFQLLNIEPVPTLYEGSADDFFRNGNTAAHWYLMAQAGAPGPGLIDELEVEHEQEIEGYVIRPAGSFRMTEFPSLVGKYVRHNHVQTHGHWMRSHFIPNKML